MHIILSGIDKVLLNFFLVPTIMLILLFIIFLTLFSTNYFFNKFYKHISVYLLYVCLIFFLLFTTLENETSLLKNKSCIFLYSFFKQVQIKINLDGISLVFIFLTLIVTLLCYFFNWDNLVFKHRSYFLFLLLTCTFLILAFSMLDIFLFYFFFVSIWETFSGHVYTFGKIIRADLSE